MKKVSIVLSICTLIFFSQCKQPGKTNTQSSVADSAAPSNKEEKAADIKYSLMPMADSGLAQLKSKYNDQQRMVILELNRIDMEHVTKKDTLVVPATVGNDLMAYSIYPKSVPYLKDINKIIFFSYPAQAWGAYEHGSLVRWGATNMGRQKDPTPTGVFSTNWKAEETRSTVKDEWILKWNFNILNKDGVGWHQYAMPGYPASHSCLRLMEDDAKYLYGWADQWIEHGKDSVAVKGTPVVVFGVYPFGSRKPWLALAANNAALNITPDAMQKGVAPHLQGILANQQKRATMPDATSTDKK